MRKTIIVIALVLFSKAVFGTELWNGFNSGSSKEEVINRAKEMLSVTRQERWDDGGMGISGQDQYGYPELERLCLYSPLPQYSQDSWCKDQYGNILAYFYDNKLFSIRIMWEADSTDVLDTAKRQYGNTANIIVEKGFFSNWNVYFWQFSEKDFFVSDSSFYIIDRIARETWVSEQQRIEEQRVADENEKRKIATDGITF